MVFYHKLPKCPEHKEDRLVLTSILIKFPRYEEGIGSYCYYCPISNKYLGNENKLVSKEEAALDFINRNYKRRTLIARIFKGKFKSSEIEALTMKEHMKTQNLTHQNL